MTDVAKLPSRCAQWYYYLLPWFTVSVLSLAPCLVMLIMPPTCHFDGAEELTQKAKIALYIWTGQFSLFLAVWSVAPLLQKCFSQDPPPNVHHTMFAMTLILTLTLFITTVVYSVDISCYSRCYPNDYAKWSTFGLTFAPFHLAGVVFCIIYKLGGISDGEKRYDGRDDKSSSPSVASEGFLPDDDKQRLLAETELKTVVTVSEKMSR